MKRCKDKLVSIYKRKRKRETRCLSHLAYLHADGDNGDEDDAGRKVEVLVQEPQSTAERLEDVERVQRLRTENMNS